MVSNELVYFREVGIRRLGGLKRRTNDLTVNIHARISQEMFNKIQEYNYKNGVSTSETVRRAFRLFFFENERLLERKKKR